MLRAVKIVIRLLAAACELIILAFVLIAAPLLWGYSPVIASGNDMMPAYPRGCLTYYAQTDPAALKEGDYIVFSSNEAVIIQRVVSVDIQKQTLTAQSMQAGYAQSHPAFSDVQGKVENWYIPYLGFAISFFNSTPLWIGVIVAILLVRVLLIFVRPRDRAALAHDAEIPVEQTAKGLCRARIEQLRFTAIDGYYDGQEVDAALEMLAAEADRVAEEMEQLRQELEQNRARERASTEAMIAVHNYARRVKNAPRSEN